MSTKPSRSQHLKLEPPNGATLTPPSSMVASRVVDVARIAFDHARRAGRSRADSADVSQEMVLKFLPLLEADSEFLRDERVRTAYTQEAVTNWFKDQWRRGRLHEKREEWIAALIELFRSDGFEAPTPDELLEEEDAAIALRNERLRRVYEAIDALPREMQRVFRDRHVNRMSIAAVAKKYRKSEGTVKQQTYRALVAIRDALGVPARAPARKKPELIS